VSIERVIGNREGLSRLSAIQFDLFELDGKRQELRRSGVVVDLPPQALRVLGILAERPDELVTRKEIQKALWPGQSFGDFDSRLNFSIKRLREALGDDAERPRYVQTVRNAGYRFIAPLREARSALSDPVDQLKLDEGGKQPDASVAAGQSSVFHLGRNGLMVALVAVATVAVAAATVLALRPREPAQAAFSGARMQAVSGSAEEQPYISFVSAVIPEAKQRIVIKGGGFGLHVAYARTDSPFLAIRDLTTHWAAGRIIPWNEDEVMVDVESWTDTEIVVSGFSGDYGVKGWGLAAGDELEVAVWNPQSGVGPALYRLTVIAEKVP
jgi:DNA-binding winged helix-turn-helix (wHTH) protein